MSYMFNEDLLKDEKILWVGQPDTKIIFSKSDIILIPFSLMWGGFAIFWEASVLSLRAPFFFKLWGIPFVLLGCYFILGRFIYKKVKKSKTYYAITNQRVITVVDGNSRNVKAEFIDKIPCLNKITNSNGHGTIQFGKSSPFAIYENSGMELFTGRRGDLGIAFYDIPDVDTVYRLFNDIQKGNM